jgi:hypothetical protein
MAVTHGLSARTTESSGRASGDGATRPRGRPPTDQTLVTAQAAALIEQNPRISIRALALSLHVGRPAARAAVNRLEEAARWACNSESAFLVRRSEPR